MTDTANHLVTEQGKFRRALAAVFAWIEAMDYPDCLSDGGSRVLATPSPATRPHAGHAFNASLTVQ